MTLRHLRIFSEVCHTESITKAADSLNMAQPAVSSVIKELEAYYGVKLFDRMNRRLYITDVGHQLLNYADSILAQLAEAKDILTDIAAASRIRIGSNVSFGLSHLADVVTDFRQKYPDIPVLTKIQNCDVIEDALLRNQLDFAITDDLAISPYFCHHLLLSEKMIAVCSPKSPYIPKAAQLSVQDLSSIPLLLREKGSGSRTIIDTILKSNNINITAAVESTSSQVLVEFCLKGHGLLIQPVSLLQKYIDEGTLTEIPVSGIDLTRNYYLVYHKSKYLTKSMQHFIDCLENFSFS